VNRKSRFRWSARRKQWVGLSPFALGSYIGACTYCERESILTFAGKWCRACSAKINREADAVKGRPHYEVYKAKKAGTLPALDGSIACVDCGRPASCYDHRDYSKPLDVSPVCRGCNVRRGMATQTAALRIPLRPRDRYCRRLPAVDAGRRGAS